MVIRFLHRFGCLTCVLCRWFMEWWNTHTLVWVLWATTYLPACFHYYHTKVGFNGNIFMRFCMQPVNSPTTCIRTLEIFNSKQCGVCFSVLSLPRLSLNVYTNGHSVSVCVLVKFSVLCFSAGCCGIYLALFGLLSDLHYDASVMLIYVFLKYEYSCLNTICYNFSWLLPWL